MSKIDWGSLGGKDGGKSGKNKTQFVKFEDGKTYILRPVGEGKEFYKFFVKSPAGNRSIVVDLEHKDEAAAKLSAKAGYEIKPQHRFAINVIDREDNTIRILEGGISIFKPFGTWSRGTNQHPGGNGGGDWMIQVEGEGTARRYNVSYIRPAPFTDEEKDRVKNKGELYKLSEIFKETALEDVVSAAFSPKGSGGKSAPDPEDDTVAELPKQKAPAGAKVDDPALW